MIIIESTNYYNVVLSAREIVSTDVHIECVGCSLMEIRTMSIDESINELLKHIRVS